jgi:hypothetical protein
MPEHRAARPFPGAWQALMRERSMATEEPLPLVAPGDPPVSDALTVYLWRGPASHLTRWAERIGLSPVALMLVGAVLCALAFAMFWRGDYWWAIAVALVFTVLDTVYRQLECRGAASKWEKTLGAAIELIHPPLWWWAWEHGLGAYGRPLAPVYATMVLWVIVGGTVAERAIEGLSVQRFGFAIQLWRPFDSRFRLISAGRNPNLAILVGALLLRRPDSGLVAIAWWTLISLIIDSVRFTQMTERQARGAPVVSWLER